MATSLEKAFKESALTFDEYFNTIREKYLERWSKNIKKVNFTDELLEFIVNIKSPINILVFGCDFCPDCAAAIPILQRIS